MPSSSSELEAPPRFPEKVPSASRTLIRDQGATIAGHSSRAARKVRLYRLCIRAAWVIALTLPLVGLVSLFLRRHLDPAWVTPRLHFSLFFLVGSGACGLAHFAGQAADRRGDARVFLLSLAFLVTGGFLAVHAIGTPGVLLNNEVPGFEVAIPVGMAIGSVFACASAFVDFRPGAAAGGDPPPKRAAPRPVRGDWDLVAVLPRSAAPTGGEQSRGRRWTPADPRGRRCGASTSSRRSDMSSRSGAG